MSEVNSSEIKRKLEAEVSYLTNLIKHHEEKKRNQSHQTHYLPRVYSSYTSRSSQTNTQNKVNMHPGKSYRFVKNNQAHFSKNRSSAEFHKPVNTKIYQSDLSFKSKYKLPNLSQFNEPIKPSFEKRKKETVFNKPMSEQDDLKLSSPQTLCKEIVSTTEKLKKKLEDMARAKLLKNLAVKRNKLPEQVQLIKSSKDNDVKKILLETDHQTKITKQKSVQIVSSISHNREEMRRCIKQPQQEFLNTTVSKSSLSKCFIQKASCTIKSEKNSKDYVKDSKHETKILNSVLKLSPEACSLTNHAPHSINEFEANNFSEPSKANILSKSENPCDAQDSHLKPVLKSKASETVSNKVETLANIASKHVSSNKHTVINKLDIAKNEKSDNLKLTPLVFRTNTKNKRKSICKSNLSLSVKKRINSKRLSASNKQVITKYKVVNKALYTFKKSNIAQIALHKKHISVSPKKQLLKSSKYCSGRLSSKYKIVNNKLFSYSPCETKYVKGKSCESPRTLIKSRENLTKYKVININSTNYTKGNSKACTTLENKLTKMPKMNNQISSKKRLNSRYKVENKPTSAKFTSENTPKCKLINRKDSLRKTKRLIHSRFAIINKKLSPRIQAWESPLKIQPMLTKRIYKSPRTIINKNVSSTYQVARMIKTKYRIVNKSKLQFIKPWNRTFSPKNRLPTAKGFSGHFIKSRSNSKSYTFPQRKKNQQFYGRTKRNFSNYNPNRTTLRIGGISYNASKTKMFRTSKKLQKYAKNEQVLSPVLVIRGVRFAIDPSGKTLRRLSSRIGNSKDHKSPRKVVVCGKTFVRVADDVLKEENSFSKSLASRVLHRSIHRVRAASTKKNMKKTNKYCQFYNRFGRCNDGIKCAYIHDPSKIAVCTRFLRGTCKVDGCLFSHEISPGKMALCSFFLLGSCNNSKCPYRHEVLTPGTKLCTDFVQGYCSKGKQCKKAHILVCPHYIQGNCEKGPLCAYPHPPQKKRKVESGDQPEHVEIRSKANTNDKKDVDDNLLDSVSRYFHCGIYRENTNVETTSENENMPVANDVSNVVVSKRCKLSVQPSFIPLSTEESEGS